MGRRIYDKIFGRKYLMYTNTAIGCFALGFADFFEQNLETIYLQQKGKERRTYDFRRTLSMMTGGLYFGFAGHHWYRFLENKFRGNSHEMVRRKLFAEAAFGPFYVSVPFIYIRLLEGKTLKEATDQLKANFSLLIAVSSPSAL
ncbi:Mpv17-like protein 2 [Dinothrombium tinctorium]|uniref:Mitochondrial inner membrane protein Mpv17 n=1 Tax=Dinothrombium tinctorium TaxID=1965070 RepID=A0A3S3NM30_9ACAR|nr:Mpv17-like protein 2 [Dinothrombium tinctorium]RWS02144.1 Mpv17-like protein 2 [Dinothrombium tinctorium]RWS02831.1 Mpv17-like protein 2 [Dinothrombium tinctorium]RWS02832.1 Mpv17-like protein 2 [Dinothrombium tinctorium]